MIYDSFAVYDEKAEAFLPPFILPNVAMAKRIFSDCVNSDTHQFGKNPYDYTLFRLGQFDDSSGQFLLERSKQPLGNGVEFIRTDADMAMEGPTDGITETDTRQQKKPNGAPVLASSSGENPPE